MLIGHKEQRVIRYILIPASIILIGIALYFVAGTPIVGMLTADIEYMTDQGKPGELRDTEVCGTFKDISDGTIEASEWIVPVTGEQYGEVSCEEIGLKAPLYYGDSDDILLKGAGQSLMSKCPGLGETTLVGAHDSTYFAPLKDLKERHTIIILTTYGKFEYIVDNINIIDSGGFQLPEDNKDGEKLILYTCYPFGDIQSDRPERIVYTCSKTSGPVIGGGTDE